MVRATDRDGVVWHVERIWAAWKVRFRLPLFDPEFDLGTVFYFVVCVLWFPFELVLSHVCGAALHLFDRPWRVVATSHTPPRQQLTWLVRGYGASESAVHEIAERIGAGEPDLWEQADRRRMLDAPTDAGGDAVVLSTVSVPEAAAQPDRSDASTRPRSSA